MHNQVTVSRVVVREAFNAGWRVGDVILEVDGKQARWPRESDFFSGGGPACPAGGNQRWAMEKRL